jgi:hypothetical protein
MIPKEYISALASYIILVEEDELLARRAGAVPDAGNIWPGLTKDLARAREELWDESAGVPVGVSRACRLPAPSCSGARYRAVPTPPVRFSDHSLGTEPRELSPRDMRRKVSRSDWLEVTEMSFRDLSPLVLVLWAWTLPIIAPSYQVICDN